jgi:hypothetical protein
LGESAEGDEVAIARPVLMKACLESAEGAVIFCDE